jgi:hypothetical protein
MRNLLDTMAHTWKPNYLEALKGPWFKANPLKKLGRPPSTNKAGHGGACACHPNFIGGLSKTTEVLRPTPGENTRPYLKNT